MLTMSLFLLFFLAQIYFLRKNLSLAFIFVAIQVISVTGSFFLGRSVPITSWTDLMGIFLVLTLLFLLIVPWKDYCQVQRIIPIDQNRLSLLTKMLIALNAYSFIILLVVVVIVHALVENVNAFKYTEGVSEAFMASNLPFPQRIFSIAIIFSYFGYFLLPLHFYYLHKGNKKLAIICLVLSFNIILLGLTYFSRAVIVQYWLLYGSLFYVFYPSISENAKSVLKKTLICTGVVLLLYFFHISTRRFETDTKTAVLYGEGIPTAAVTRNPLLYSFIDYLSQGYVNGIEVVHQYRGEGFHGSLTFAKILSIVSTPEKAQDRARHRLQVWPGHYSYSFLGFPAYAIYDYGIFGSLFLCIIYFIVVRRWRPRDGVISLKHLFLLIFLIQIPLMSIFYNVLGELIIAVIFWVPIQIYISYKTSFHVKEG